MVGLKYIGFKTATVEKRKMTVGELRHRLAKRYLKKENEKFIILFLDDGERLEINSMEDALNFEWSDSCNIEIINEPHRYGVLNEFGHVEDDAPCIIIAQFASEEINENEKTVL